MIKSAFLLCFMAGLQCMNDSLANDLDFSLNEQATVKIFKGLNSKANLEELKNNHSIVSIVFLGQAKSSEISEVLQLACKLPTLKFLRFMDESVDNVKNINPELFKKVRVFAGLSNPELSWRRIWKLPLAL